MSTFCTNCGRDLGGGMRICGACGVAVAEVVAEAGRTTVGDAVEAGVPNASSGWSSGGDPARHAVPLDGGSRHRPSFDPRGLRLLGSWVEGVIWILAAIQLPALYYAIRQRTLFDELIDTESFSAAVDLEDAENTWLGLNLLSLLLLLTTTVLLMVWMYRLHGQATSLGATHFRMGRGFTIGAWFIPVANVVMVPMMLSDLDRTMRAERLPIGRGWRDLRTSGLVWLYGVGAVLSWGIGNLADGSQHDLATATTDQISDVFTARVVENVVTAITAVALAWFVRRVRRDADRVATLSTRATSAA